MGMVGGTWMARVPAAKAQAHLSDGTLGAALFAVPIGLVLGAALAERLVDRVGSAWVARVAGIGNCLLMMTPGLASSLPELMAALLVWGIAGGTLDVAQNAQGLRVEGEYGRPVMTSMHAFFSLGAIIGALVGGGFAWAGVGLLPSLAVVGLTGAVIDAAPPAGSSRAHTIRRPGALVSPVPAANHPTWRAGACADETAPAARWPQRQPGAGPTARRPARTRPRPLVTVAHNAKSLMALCLAATILLAQWATAPQVIWRWGPQRHWARATGLARWSCWSGAGCAGRSSRSACSGSARWSARARSVTGPPSTSRTTWAPAPDSPRWGSPPSRSR